MNFEELTAREREIVTRIFQGFSTRQIAFELDIADSTVRVLTARAAAKLGVRGREAIRQLEGLREFIDKELDRLFPKPN